MYAEINPSDLVWITEAVAKSERSRHWIEMHMRIFRMGNRSYVRKEELDKVIEENRTPRPIRKDDETK